MIPQEGVGRRIFRRRQQYQQQQAAAAGALDADGQGSMEQGAVFLEPISWMGDQVVGPVQGKLYCPKCNTRLGSFNWSGRMITPRTLQTELCMVTVLHGHSSAAHVSLAAHHSNSLGVCRAAGRLVCVVWGVAVSSASAAKQMQQL